MPRFRDPPTTGRSMRVDPMNPRTADFNSAGGDHLGYCPNSLLQYFSRAAAPLANRFDKDPPKKRQRLDREEDLDYMVVKRSSVHLKFRQPTPRTIDTPLKHQSLTATTVIAKYGKKVMIRIRDKVGADSKVLDGAFEVDNVPLRDIEIAAEVAYNTSSKHNPTLHGRLYTETGFLLSTEDGFDVLQLTWTVKWNFSPSLEYISEARPVRPVLDSVIAAYFPDPSLKGVTHTTTPPQAFYDCVHVPEKKDPVAASIETPLLDTQLYPFQKRAVRWLLEKEGAQWSEERGSVEPALSTSSGAPYSFYKVVDEDNRVCWVNSIFKAVTSDLAAYKASDNLLGGLLVEEMGLGKTLEIIALISLHRRPPDITRTIDDPYLSRAVRPIGATLIITPPSILSQWESELARHAPSLKVFRYEGLKKHKRLTERQLFDKIADQDVVLVTYRVLSSEIHLVAPPAFRERRDEAAPSRPSSPFTYFSWWRCVFDEAQMIESGVTQAAKVARRIPRINAWGVTGTPVKKDGDDLLGLLMFLRYEPYATLRWTWDAILKLRFPFQDLFQQIALRHTKHLVRDELQLPPQKRYVITMPFTPVEEQYYQSLFQEMCEECGLDLQGAPANINWNPDDPRTVTRMRTWLERLRRSTLHPEIGAGNRRALGGRVLGGKDGPLRTVDQVLETMLEQTELSIRVDQRALLLSRLKRGQLLENSLEVKEALEIWSNVLEDVNAIVFEHRQQLQREIDAFRVNGVRTKELDDGEDSSDDGTSSDAQETSAETSVNIGALRSKLNTVLEVQHMAAFFCANAYFQMKTNEEMTKADSAGFEELERLETEGYEEAKKIRQEILKEIILRNAKPMKMLAKKASSEDFSTIPEFHTDAQKGGIESRRILENLETLAVILDAQANQLDEWREVTIQHLLRSLVDEDEGVAITGEEYEQSTKTQEEVVVYVQALRAVIEDRHDALSGQENQLVKFEMKTALRQAKAGDGAFPEKVLELLNIRAGLKPAKEMGSVRGVLSDLRALATQLRTDANGSSRAANELAIVERNMRVVQKHLNEQNKAVVALRREIDDFTTLMNLRVEYYKQLQQVSDMVAPLEDPAPDLEEKLLESEEKLASKIAAATSKRRYLLHLQEESTGEAEEKVCVICQVSFENGSLTVCGHIFCKVCMGLWWRAHHNCPVCKRKLTMNDLHDITYKPQELKVVEEDPVSLGNQERAVEPSNKKSAIYSQVSKDTLAEIKSIDLNGPSFTTKVDTLCRHLLWLRESDPGAKSVIFSQFAEFLDVLGRAFEHHRIGYSRIDKPSGIEKFKEDPATECFLLHARSQSSGLNLVNASHVFLCEPLINTALELQAIARVDRIGQQQTTTVWLYLVDGTVEESIYDISVRRRMEHVRQESESISKEGTPELLDSKIEVANSLELQQAQLSNLVSKGKAEGETVDKKDFWECLFGNRKEKGPANNAALEQLDRVVAHQFGLEAAEARRAEEL